MSSKIRTYNWPTVDEEFQELGVLGYTGSINDRLFAYLSTLGYSGSLTDMLADFHSFSPLNLFSSGEAGVWYDPSDLSTMFQDSTGTTPVIAAGDPVGLMLDKAQGGLNSLGSETVTNGDFSSGLTGWTQNAAATGTATVVDGELVYSAPHGDYAETKQTNASVVSKTYKVTFEVIAKVSSSTNVTIQFGRVAIYNSSISGLAVGTHSAIIKSTHTDGFSISVRTDGEVTIDNVSACEVPGNHATQADNNARRPSFQQAGGLSYLDFDGVDDVMNASLDWVQFPHYVCVGAEGPSGSTADLIGSGGVGAPNSLLQVRAALANKGRAHVWTTGGLSTVDFDATDAARLVVNQKCTATTLEAWSNNDAPVSTGVTGTLAGGTSLVLGDRQTTGSGSDNFNGKFFGCVVLLAEPTDNEVSQTISYMAQKSGVVL